MEFKASNNIKKHLAPKKTKNKIHILQDLSRIITNYVIHRLCGRINKLLQYYQCVYECELV